VVCTTPTKPKELPLNLDEAIAWITLDPKTGEFVKIIVYQKHLRFTCQQCATFCCKLGGPCLSYSDITRITEQGLGLKDYLDQISRNRSRGSRTLPGVLKTRPDGSCIFLQSSFDGDCHKCAIYDSRPALCRLYPFHLELIDQTSLRLGIIPCCNGLNTPTGEIVDEDFINQHLRDSIIDILRSNLL
jgi:Fe-S-cluster containining protein